MVVWWEVAEGQLASCFECIDKPEVFHAMEIDLIIAVLCLPIKYH